MKKYLFFALALVAMATACSKNEPMINPESGTPIKLSGKALNIENNAPQINSNLRAFIPASITSGDYTTTYASGTMSFTGNVTAYEAGYAGSKLYPADGTTVYLVGLSPATGWSTPTTTSAFTFTGVEDILSAPEVSTTRSDGDESTYKNLTFTHKLTKIEITIEAENQGAANVWGKVNEITLTKNLNSETFANIATVTLADDATTFSGTTATSWPLYDITANTVFAGKEIALTTTAQKVAYTMVVPVKATGTADYTLSVKVTSGRGAQVTQKDVAINLKTAEGDAFTGSTAGNNFVVKLTFKANEIEPTATITHWKSTGSGSADVGGPVTPKVGD